jgi:AcrR family transcriptional regulator
MEEIMARIARHTVEETKATIQKAFVELYMEERLEKVTVGAISQRAGINRGTFYHYYQDVYDILEQIENEYINDISEIIPILLHGLLNHTLSIHFTKLAPFYNKHKEVLLLFLVKQPNAKVINQTKALAKAQAMKELNLDANHLTVKQKCLIEYIANAQIGIVGWWLEHGSVKDLPIFAQTMNDANNYGPLTTLKKTAKLEN